MLAASRLHSFGAFVVQRFLSSVFRKLPAQSRPVVATCVYGTTAGLGAVAFGLCIELIYRQTYERLAESSPMTFLVGSFLVILLTSLAVGYLLSNFCASASGSGIPQLKVAFWKDFGYVPWRVAWVKFVAGVLSVGGGCSLGREGPSVQLAGGVASQMAGLIGEPKQNRRLAAAAGAAAGLAAAFNAPLAAVTFVLEEIIEDLNSRFLGGVLLASVLGAFVVHAIVGKQPAFTLAPVETTGWVVYVLTPIVAAVATLVGLVFQRTTLSLRKSRKRFEDIPLWVRPSIGGVITWGLGATVFLLTGSLGVFGLGYSDLSAALSGEYSWKLAGILLVTKLIATVCCYGFGGSGGIFAPLLFFGAMCGIFISGLCEFAIHLSVGEHITLAVVGMSACLGAVVWAPVTGILIVFELTHDFGLVPALMMGALVSSAISRRLSKHNFYDEILVQDGHNLEHVIPPRDLRSWHELPVSAIAHFEPVMMTDLSPEGMRKVLRESPYAQFPVMVDGELQGVLSRTEAERAILEKCAPDLQPAEICPPSEKIRDVQNVLITAPSGLVILKDRTMEKVLGIVTLHDLLRAEVAMTKDQT